LKVSNPDRSPEPLLALEGRTSPSPDQPTSSALPFEVVEFGFDEEPGRRRRDLEQERRQATTGVPIADRSSLTGAAAVSTRRTTSRCSGRCPRPCPFRIPPPRAPSRLRPRRPGRLMPPGAGRCTFAETF
jgi:hypothetical protein